MDMRKRNALKALVVLLAFSFAQVYVRAGLPDPPAIPSAPQRAISGRLITKNNAPITVNGNTTGTGATILAGATIETPDQVGASIDLGDAGVIELQPNSKIQLDFDANGNVRVKVIRGCAVTRKKTNVLPGEMEIYTDKASEKTDKKRRHMGFCILPDGGLSSFSAGLSSLEVGGIVAGVSGAVIGTGILVSRGGNPSPAN